MHAFGSRLAMLVAAALVLTGVQAGFASVVLPDLDSFENDPAPATLSYTAVPDDSSIEPQPVDPRAVKPPRKAVPASNGATVVASTSGPALIAPATLPVVSDIATPVLPEPSPAFAPLTPTNIFRPPRSTT